MEAESLSTATYFAAERKQVTGKLERQAKKLEKRARQLRADSLKTWRTSLAEEAAALRQEGDYSGSVEQALLHYYGGELQDEVLAELGDGRYTANNWVDFLDFAQRLQGFEGLVPAVINSPQYVTYRDGSAEWREYVFALVDAQDPFYAIRILFAEDGKILTPAEDDSAARELKSFGLRGNFTSVDTPEDERTVGGIGEGRTYVSGGDVELMINDNPYYNRKVSPGIYRDQHGSRNRITTNSAMRVEYTLGWQAVEDLIYAEQAGERRNTAARKIGKYLLPSSIEPEEVMPKAGKIVNAVRTLDAVTSD